MANVIDKPQLCEKYIFNNIFQGSTDFPVQNLSSRVVPPPPQHLSAAAAIGRHLSTSMPPPSPPPGLVTSPPRPPVPPFPLNRPLPSPPSLPPSLNPPSPSPRPPPSSPNTLSPNPPSPNPLSPPHSPLPPPARAFYPITASDVFSGNGPTDNAHSCAALICYVEFCASPSGTFQYKNNVNGVDDFCKPYFRHLLVGRALLVSIPFLVYNDSPAM